jgi:hypothetical protein
MDEESFVMVSPYDGVVGLDSDGVDSVKGLEVVEVRY